MEKSDNGSRNITDNLAGTEPLQLRVQEDHYRAFQRCMWIIINETGRTQMDVMDEMVRDFLVKHGC